jgi:dolichol-phosphate mannosyltransferase
VRPLVVLPTYCEAENVVDVLERLRAAVPHADVLVVDDASPDGTAAVARREAERLGRITVLDRAGKGGLGAAYRAGFTHGLDLGYDVLVEIDADLSHDPAALPQLLSAVERGADLAIGSRYVPGGSIPDWPWHRRALSRWGNRYAAFALGIRTSDATSGYRAYRADTLKAADYLTTRATGYAFQIELVYRVIRGGGTVAEVPITFVDRTRGGSKMSLRIAAEAMLLVTGWGVLDRLRRVRRSRR